jgi:precorrin-2 dehydrogenase / sirohydrochlorin ferrochelatase
MKVIKQNNLFPIFLQNFSFLIFGGGHLALNRLFFLQKNLTSVYIISDNMEKPIKINYIINKKIKLIKIFYKKKDIEKTDLLILAEDNFSLLEKIWMDAKKFGKLINFSDFPSFCDFYFGSLLKKGNLKISISTNGKSPTFSKRFRDLLSEVFTEDISLILDRLYPVRKKLKGSLSYKMRVLNIITSESIIEKFLSRGIICKKNKCIFFISIFVYIILLFSFILFDKKCENIFNYICIIAIFD